MQLWWNHLKAGIGGSPSLLPGVGRRLVILLAVGDHEIGPDGHKFLEAIQFDGDLKEDGNEDKLAPKIEAIKDCAILYVAAIGGSGAARVVANNIHPMKVNQPEDIADLLAKLEEVLKGTPPPWLRKALSKGKEKSLDFED